MKDIKRQRLKRLIIYTMLAGVIGLILYIIYELTGLGFKCPVNEFLGIKCAGCGNTHFVGSLLKLNFKEAFSYNYLFPLELFYIAWVYSFSAKRYLNGGKFNYIAPFKALDIACLIIIGLWIPLRNIWGV